MKKIYTYLLALLAVISVSCEKTGIDPSAEVELTPKGGYIRFSTKVSTKAPIFTNLRGNSFGVLGYEYSYSTNWETARSTAAPTVFYDQTVDCDENGVCMYDINSSVNGNQLKPWDLKKKYAFFGYFPQQDGNGITISKANVTNTPTINYELPLSNNPVLPENLCDLMTAYAVDETAGGGTVGLTFQHKLFCIEVLAQNFNETAESISELTLTIDNLKYQSITLPMKNDEGTTVVYGGIAENNDGKVNNDKKYQFRLIDNSDDSVSVPGNSGQVSLSGGNRMIMLIPQENGISGFITIDNDTYDFSFANEMKERRKYNLVINFTGSTIVIATAEVGSWESVEVKHEFE
jgi:hypothetical protein